MLRRATCFVMAGGRRSFSGKAPAAEEMFIEAWKKAMPNIDPPNIPLSFMQPYPPASGSISSKLTLNFYLPHSPEVFNKQVDMVIVPATTGQMGILPGHVATMSELKPGVLSVHEGTETTKYFISNGFAFVHPNSVTDVVALEAAPLDRIDLSVVEKGLSEYSHKLKLAMSEYEKAEAQIGVDVHTALHSALTA